MERVGQLWRTLRDQLKSFGARLMQLYLLLLLIPVAGIGLYGHSYLQRTINQQALHSILDEVAVRAYTIEVLLSQMHSDILYLGQHLTTNPAHANDDLNGLAASHPMYRHIAYVDDTGAEVAGHLSTTLAQWVQSDDFARVMSTGGNSGANRIWTMPLRDADEARNQARHMMAAVRVADGVLVLEINTAYLLQGLVTDATGHAWALFIDPDILLTSRAEDVTAFGELSREQMGNRSGYYEADDRLTFYNRTGMDGTWTLMRSVPRDRVTADLSGYYTTFFILIVGALISVAGLALFAIARIIEPLYQLERMVDAIRQGKSRPTFRLASDRQHDEFGKLMSAFDQMATELDQKRKNERALIEQLIKAQEEERKLIAYDLHDGLIQLLVGARFTLGQCRQRCQPDSDVAIQQPAKPHHIANAYGVLTNAIAEGRRIIQGLHPTVLDDVGLEAALIDMGESMARTAGWQIHFDVPPLPQQPDRVVSVTLYRIAQEALNNAYKHAQASQVWLSLDLIHLPDAPDDDTMWLCLRVRDDGCGFDTRTMTNGHMTSGGQHWGLRTMRERTTMLRGVCQLRSGAGEGTRVQVQIPVSG